MIPFRDENPTRRFPLVVVALIAANIVIFLYQVLLPGPAAQVFAYTHGAIPAVLAGQVSFAEALPSSLRQFASLNHEPVAALQPIWLTLFTAMFLHGNLLHLGGNMLFLWVFGNNIEEALGHVRFVLFYFLCGALAAGAQILMSLHSLAPMIGASGAIAGVLGAYYMKYPRARVHCLVFLVFFVTVVVLPAGLVLLVWFLLQILYTAGSVGGVGAEGVAVFAHIGGFVAGWALVRRFEPRRRLRWVT